jgi:hypothetical protein
MDGRPGNRGFISGRAELLLFSTASKSTEAYPASNAMCNEPISQMAERQNVKMTANFNVVARLKCMELYFYSSTRLHGVALN